jgi:hypothetical protein
MLHNASYATICKAKVNVGLADDISELSLQYVKLSGILGLHERESQYTSSTRSKPTT